MNKNNIKSEYKPNHPYLWIVVGALVGLAVAGHFAWTLVTQFSELSWWEILLFAAGIICVMFHYADLGARTRASSYSIKDGNLYFSNPLSKIFHDSVVVPIDSIRYVEFLSGGPKERRVRIVYNKFDDLYINTRNNEALITDLLRVNPDIEIRREK